MYKREEEIEGKNVMMEIEPHPERNKGWGAHVGAIYIDGRKTSPKSLEEKFLKQCAKKVSQFWSDQYEDFANPDGLVIFGIGPDEVRYTKSDYS